MSKCVPPRWLSAFRDIFMVRTMFVAAAARHLLPVFSRTSKIIKGIRPWLFFLPRFSSAPRDREARHICDCMVKRYLSPRRFFHATNLEAPKGKTPCWRKRKPCRAAAATEAATSWPTSAIRRGPPRRPWPFRANGYNASEGRATAGPQAETAYTVPPFFSPPQWRAAAPSCVRKKKRTQIVSRNPDKEDGV